MLTLVSLATVNAPLVTWVHVVSLVTSPVQYENVTYFPAAGSVVRVTV